MLFACGFFVVKRHTCKTKCTSAIQLVLAFVITIGAEKGEAVKKTDRLPGTVKKFLHTVLKSKEELRGFAQVDLDEEQGFICGYLILTKSRLLFIECEYETETIQLFGGCKREYDNAGEIKYSKQYLLQSISSLKVVPEVSRHYLLMEDNEGREERICFFSGTARKDIYEMVRLIMAEKEGKEYAKETDDENYCKICGTLYPDPERKICPKCMDKKTVFFRMLSYLKPYIGKFVIMAICYLLIALLNLAWPYLSGAVLYDQVLAENPEFMNFISVPGNRYAVLLGFTVLAMFLAKLSISILSVIQGVLTAKIVPELVMKMKTEVFLSMGKMELHFFQSNQTGGLMTRVLSDANRVSSLFIDGLPYFLIDLLTITVTVAVMLRLNWILALIVIIILPLITLLSVKMMPGLYRVNTRQHQAAKRMSALVNDNITGARVVKAFGREEQENNRFRGYNERVRDVAMDMAVYDNKFFILYKICTQLARLAVWSLGGFLIIQNSSLEIGVLVTFVGYISQLEDPLDYFSHFFRWASRSINSAQRIFEIIDAVPKIKEKPDAIHPEKIRGELELSGVTFGYEQGKSILKDISFHVEEGKVLGIVGKSGAGKTTLVSLISRLYDPDEGEVLIDGINVKDMGFHELRSAIAMVSQETYIFSGTVAENIRYGNEEATDEQVVLAARQAGAHDFICKMPDGYDTIVGTNGRSLSGGEKQRVSIARAILANPRILILDEATSAVDTETELIIQKSLELLSKGRTTLSIAHRLSTLRNADSLIVIDEGRVTEKGTHKELIEKKGTYYHLMELQTKALAMRGLD